MIHAGIQTYFWAKRMFKGFRCSVEKGALFLCALSFLSPVFIPHKHGISSLEQYLCELSFRETSLFVYLHSAGQAEVRIQI